MSDEGIQVGGRKVAPRPSSTLPLLDNVCGPSILQCRLYPAAVAAEPFFEPQTRDSGTGGSNLMSQRPGANVQMALPKTDA